MNLIAIVKAHKFVGNIIVYIGFSGLGYIGTLGWRRLVIFRKRLKRR